VYLAVLAGDGEEVIIAHFRSIAENADANSVGTFPTEVLVNLLLRINRPSEVLAIARRYSMKSDNNAPASRSRAGRPRITGRWRSVAREQGDPVHFMAGLLEAGQ
jgi:hypothetical protein